MQAKLSDFGLHKRVRRMLTSGTLVSWTADASYHGAEYERSYYGGNNYINLSKRGSEGALNALATVQESSADLAPIGALKQQQTGPSQPVNYPVMGAPFAGDKAGVNVPGSMADSAGSYQQMSLQSAVRAKNQGLLEDTDFVTHVLQLTTLGSGNEQLTPSLIQKTKGVAGADKSVHRKLAAVKALDGSVRAGNAYNATASGKGFVSSSGSSTSGREHGATTSSSPAGEIEVAEEGGAPNGMHLPPGNQGGAAGTGIGNPGVNSAGRGSKGVQRMTNEELDASILNQFQRNGATNSVKYIEATQKVSDVLGATALLHTLCATKDYLLSPRVCNFFTYTNCR